VTIALRPSEEQLALFPDLRDLAATADVLDKSALRKDRHGRPHRTRAVSGRMVARPPSTSAISVESGTDGGRSKYGHMSYQGGEHIQHPQHTRLGSAGGGITGRREMARSVSAQAARLAPGASSTQSSTERQRMCDFREAHHMHEHARAVRAFSDAMAQSTWIATALCVSISCFPTNGPCLNRAHPPSIDVHSLDPTPPQYCATTIPCMLADTPCLCGTGRSGRYRRRLQRSAPLCAGRFRIHPRSVSRPRTSSASPLCATAYVCATCAPASRRKGLSPHPTQPPTA
jgi:hypothetical protein